MDKRKKRIILIGRSSAGKTTLCQYISNEALRYHKTQTVEVVNKTMIDTPGEYLERNNYRGALQVSSIDADVIVLVQDSTEDGSMFPPAYASSFAKPVIGVVTKSDLADERQIERSIIYLKNAGATDIFITSSVEGSGFEGLLKYLNYD
ncbi:MAG: EutP/PduV family microcompartment system protein [Clostridiales bacterium]|jgi:ethanolamine utilization protein EutP|nr:EutP/PduV family microcompartment system protein [Clostridiales bacterium]